MTANKSAHVVYYIFSVYGRVGLCPLCVLVYLTCVRCTRMHCHHFVTMPDSKTSGLRSCKDDNGVDVHRDAAAQGKTSARACNLDMYKTGYRLGFT